MTNKMTKQELISDMATTANISKNDAENALNAFLDLVVKTVKEGGEVQIANFGAWKPKERKARTGRNPQTGLEIKIPAKKTTSFKAGKRFVDALNA